MGERAERWGRLRRWRGHVGRYRPLDLTYRVVIAVLGCAVIGLGVVLLPLPGPGWLVIFLGLGILATEFVWAGRLLTWTREQVGRWTRWIAGQSVPVRLLIGAGCLAVVVAAVGLYLWWQGLPAWLGDALPPPDAAPAIR